GIPTGEIERLKDSIKMLVDAHLDTRPAPLHFKTIETPEDANRSVLIVQVSQNTYSLSMVKNELNQFWVRRHTDNRLMTTDEIQYEFERMTKIRDSAKDELDRIRENLENKESAWPIVWFAAVPVARSRDHVPVVINTLEDIINNSSYYKAFSGELRNTTLPTPAMFWGDYRPSLHGIGLKRSANKGGRFEVRRDGTIIFGIRPVMSDDTVPLGLIYTIWCSGLHLLKDIQERFSLSELAVVQAGLTGCSRRDILGGE
ncbi:unnamed protein product, partial [marine sediment metagenome]